MIWVLLGGGLTLCAIAAWMTWRKWVAPWDHLGELVAQIGRGGQPETYLIDGAEKPRRVALALEAVVDRHTDLTRQLAKQESGAQTIFAAMNDGLLVVDSAGRIVLANEAFRQFFGLPRIPANEPLLENVRDATLDQMIARALRKGTISCDEITLADTTFPRRIELNAVPTQNEAGQITGAVVLFHDITELKRVDQMRRDFVANVSHELRTPLSILRGYLETLQDDPDLSPDETARILAVMEKHALRLRLLLDDLLTLTQLETGHWKLRPEAIDTAAFLAEIVRDWEKDFAKKRLQISVEPGVPKLWADEVRLRQAIDNLLQNAVRYTEDGGAISIAVEPHEQAFVLSVADNGIGVAPANLPRIFERFYRVDAARSRELGGTGLGLAIVKHIAHLHGGRVEGESALGSGTTIRLVLPRSDEPVTQT